MKDDQDISRKEQGAYTRATAPIASETIIDVAPTYSINRRQVQIEPVVGAKNFALYGGLVMVIMSALAIAFPGPIQGLPFLNVEYSYGMFLNYFPMNIVNKALLIFFGFTGMICSTKTESSLGWARVIFVFMGLGALLGIAPQTYTFFGYIPLFGGEVVGHAFFSLLGLYFAYFGMDRTRDEVTIKNDKNIHIRNHK